MLKENKIRIAIALALAIIVTICVAFIPSGMDAIAFAADEHISTEEINFGANADAFAYSIAPEYIYPFVYNGTAPTSYLDINTTNCVNDYLYIYNMDTNALIQISTSQVITYTATTDGIFYIDSDYQIILSDYLGDIQIPIYQLEEKSYANFDYFDGILYFIEDARNVCTIDLETRRKTTIVQSSAISAALMVDRSKLLWKDDNDSDFVFDISNNTSIALATPLDVNRYVNNYALPQSLNPVSPANEVNTTTSSINDISFPFSGTVYDADLYTVWTFTPTYYFHNQGIVGATNYEDTMKTPFCLHPRKKDDPRTPINGKCAGYAEDNQCVGFAKFAYDRYYHTEDWSKTFDEWFNNSEKTAKELFDKGKGEQEENIRLYFTDMLQGTYVRYGKDTVTNVGDHSMVFDKLHESGIIVYECNQDEQCGITYGYWTFALIKYNYDSVAYTYRHCFSDEYTMLDSSSHKYLCDTTNCEAYLVQPHTGTGTFTSNSDSAHIVNYSCCDGLYLDDHNIGYTYTSTYHTAHCNSCGWSKTYDHTFIGTRCKTCGYDTDGPISIGWAEPIVS